ncbi:hypothetical protein [Pseudalkalibacillus caeni]|uniref:Uncharacterized protein n=1 Tax=Exobacillus caeni TaxID=2574798 RepID=A0A5R9F7C5_9BACL|nr:hypothetical protein [Pseudalkalibacillus caeni]TLS37528.1 hypothetical protein FCL54_10325 [Pseudalkalibacillus caeni]
MNNQWEGIKLTTVLKKNEKYRGLTFHQYYLLLPGSPVVCHYVVVEQRSPEIFLFKDWYMDGFFKPDQRMSNSWLETVNEAGRSLKVHGGKGEVELDATKGFTIGSDTKPDILQIVTDQDDAALGTYVNKQVIQISVGRKINLAPRDIVSLPPVFFVFNEKAFPIDTLKDLASIRF